jgi:hypothetical protein
VPASSISHTFVTGGRTDLEPPPAGAGAGVAGVEDSGVAGELGELAALEEALEALLDAVAGAGVACAVTAGGGVVVEVGVGLERARSIGSSSGTREAPAREASGAGPIAAPTAMPTASIAAARIALARLDGRRTALPGGGAGVADGAGGGPVGGVGVSGISVIACRQARDMAPETASENLR